MSGRDPHRGLRTAATAEVGAERLSRIRSLLEAAFAERPEGGFGPDDWTHCLGGVHVWAQDDEGEVLAHASVVQRRLLHGDRVLRCGYVEAVAVRADRRRTGLGTAVMQVVDDLVRVVTTWAPSARRRSASSCTARGAGVRGGASSGTSRRRGSVRIRANSARSSCSPWTAWRWTSTAASSAAHGRATRGEPTRSPHAGAITAPAGVVRPTVLP